MKSNADYTVTQRPRDDVLQFKLLPAYDYTMKLKINVPNEVQIPIMAFVPASYNSRRYIPGNYYDNAAFILEF